MPAVDLDRLARQVESLLAAGTDPQTLARGCLDLLEHYRNRSRRSAAAQQVAPRVSAFGAPRPLLRALGRALRDAMRDRPDEALMLAALLWHRESWETRSLAILLLADIAGDEAAAWAEPRAAECGDLDLLDDLAGRGLGRWRREHPEAFLAFAARWLTSDSASLRAMALLAMRAEADQSGSRSIPAILRLLPASLSVSRGIARTALLRLLHTLARCSPREAALLLRDNLASGSADAADLLRATLPAFPEPQRSRLRRALAEQRAAGIMPATL